MLTLRVDQIKPNNWNCNYLGVQETQTLKQRLIQDGPQKTPPIIVRKLSDDAYYEIVDGEHRWLIANELGWQTINAIEQNVDDQQSKALCIIYNKVRGHLNWMKLYNVVKQDQQQGVNLFEAYKNALNEDELGWLLSFDNLSPDMQTPLEEAIKKHPEITLEQLHLLALFPHQQQKRLVEKFKNSMVTHALNNTLNAFTAITPKTLPLYTQDNSPFKQDFLTEQQQSDPTQTQRPENPQTSTDLTQTVDRIQQQQIPQREVTPALMTVVSYDCACGRHYRVNFENATITAQKQNQLFEYVDIKPNTFRVHCGKCNNNHNYTIKNPEKEQTNIICTRCKPHRKGILDVNAGEVTWID